MRLRFTDQQVNHSVITLIVLLNLKKKNKIRKVYESHLADGFMP